MVPDPAPLPEPGAAEDRDLITAAAEAAGRIAMPFFRASCESWEKAEEAGPVSEADMAVNAYLEETLRGARPDYGWLSEESEDGSDRLSRARVFIVDPIDGTRAFLKGETGFAVAIAVVEHGAVTASTVHLPARGETYAAALGLGATLNGAAIAPSPRTQLAGATAVGAGASYKPEHWPGGVPEIKRSFRHALEWRLCLIADGSFDLMVTLRDAYEWDVAAGALIVTEAGARISDRDGAPLAFNSPCAKLPGVIAAPAPLHAALTELRQER